MATLFWHHWLRLHFSSTGRCINPKCAVCEYGKSHWQPTRSTFLNTLSERENVLKGNTLFLWQRVSLSHFVCSAKGYSTFSKGITPSDSMNCGRAIFMDKVSWYIFIQSQATFSLVETIQAKLTFEQICLSCGVCLWFHIYLTAELLLGQKCLLLT